MFIANPSPVPLSSALSTSSSEEETAGIFRFLVLRLSGAVAPELDEVLGAAGLAVAVPPLPQPVLRADESVSVEEDFLEDLEDCVGAEACLSFLERCLEVFGLWWSLIVRVGCFSVHVFHFPSPYHKYTKSIHKYTKSTYKYT